MNLPAAPPGRFHEDAGLWIYTAAPPLSEPRPALFLDRDGVIIEDPGYLCRASDLVMIPGAAELIREANRLRIPVVEITNQAGIGRGYYGWEEFAAVEEALARRLAQSGAAVDAILACPYYPDGVAPWAHPDHPARKPRPGMLLAAQRLLNLDLPRSWIVGDRLTDLQAGYNAGLRGGLHVLSGSGPEHRQAVLEWRPPGFELRLGSSLCEAAAVLTTME